MHPIQIVFAIAGKTLLAKAIAGEAGVRFLSVAGTEFDQLAEPYPERGNVPSENDEAIALALQEEWSQLAVNETAVRSKRSQDEHAWLAASKGICLSTNYELSRIDSGKIH